MTKEERNEYNRLWRLKHPEKMKQYSIKYAGRYSDQQREYRQKQRAKYKEYAVRYRKENPEKCSRYRRKYDLKRKYGMTLEEYEHRFQEQHGLCDICGESQKNLKRQLHVDHNHTTGNPRGLLCSNCNHSVGCFERDPLFFDKIKKYLEKWKN